MNTRTKIAAIGLSAVALAGAVGAGISYADDPTTSPSPSAGASTPGAQPKEKGERAKRPLLKRALHGEVTVGGQQTRVLAFQRGTVQKASTSAITVTSRDGFTGTYVVTADTRIRQHGAPGSITDIAAGDTVRVVGVKDGGTVTATTIGEPKP